MLYDIKELNENDYKKECARLLIAFENLSYKYKNDNDLFLSIKVITG